MAKITQMNISADELGGLFLQNSFLAPAGVDPKNFEFYMDQQLDLLKIPFFSKVATRIQKLLNKMKNKMAVAPEFHPIEIKAMNFLFPQPLRYKPPQQCGIQNTNAPQPKTNLSVDKATCFQG